MVIDVGILGRKILGWNVRTPHLSLFCVQDKLRIWIGGHICKRSCVRSFKILLVLETYILMIPLHAIQARNTSRYFLFLIKILAHVSVDKALRVEITYLLDSLLAILSTIRSVWAIFS